MSQQDWDQIQNCIDQMKRIIDPHVNLSVSVRTQSNGQIYVDMGRFGNATVNTSHEANLFLQGILMGMNVNRG